MNRLTMTAFRVAGTVLAILLVLSATGPALSLMLQHTEESTYDLPADVSRLVLDGDVGDVEVRAAAPGEGPGAMATARSGLTDPSIEVAETDGVASLESSCDRLWIETCQVSWEVVVPAEAAVRVSTSVGDVTVTGANGPLDLRSSVGDVTAVGVRGQALSLDSSVGDIEVVADEPPEELIVRSSTGDVAVTVPDDGTEYRVSTSTSVGDVRNGIGSADAATRRIDVTTSVGDIALLRVSR